MRQLAYALLLTSAGCSLIYNPSNLPAAPSDGGDDVDMAIDAREIIDANAAMPVITSVAPAQLFEGTGTSNGRKAVVVVTGENFVEGAKIIIALHDETTQAPKIIVDDANTDVSEDHKMVAAPVTLEVDPGLDANNPAERLDVIVTQPNGGSTAMVAFTTLPGDMPVLERVGLDELTDASLPNGGLPTNPTGGVHLFSEVTLTTALTAADATKALQIRATGGITIDTASVSASGRPGGPGASSGGAGGTTLSNAGKPGGNPGGGVTDGGGGGYGTAGGGGANGGTTHGDAELTVLSSPNRGAGGAGGNFGLGGDGGDGGGGGGGLELTAGGAIVVTDVAANGADGGAGGNSGGGGSGGLILLRGASVATSGTITATGGVGGGMGGDGRIRVDSTAAVPSTNPAAYRGPMLAAATPVIVRTAFPTLTFLGQPQRTAKYEISNADGSSVRNIVDQNLGNGSNTVALTEALFEGLNTICLYVDKADITMADQRPEARNCIQIVYLFKNP